MGGKKKEKRECGRKRRRKGEGGKKRKRSREGEVIVALHCDCDLIIFNISEALCGLYLFIVSITPPSL